MANAIELITKYSSKAWDKVYKAEARSSVLDGEKELLKFTGTKTVKIAKFASSGLFDYHRANKLVQGKFGGQSTNTYDATDGITGYGYQQGDASLTWEEFTLRIDRGAQFRVELFDDEETDGLAVAMTTTEISRTQVIPEVDAYCFSELAKLAGTIHAVDINPAAGMGNAGAPITELNTAFKKLEDEEVPAEEQVIFASTAFYNALRSTNELYRRLDQEEYKKDVNFTIGEYEGRKIIPVPPRRFRTLVKLLGGSYGFDANSKGINFIVCAKSAVYHIVKYDKVRVFAPAVVQDFDGYKVNIRIYHDLFVPDNKRVAIYACVESTASGVASPVVHIEYDATSKVLNKAYCVPGEVLFDAIYQTTGTADLAIGTEIDVTPTSGNATLVHVGDALTAGKFIVFGLAGKVVANGHAAIA